MNPLTLGDIFDRWFKLIGKTWLRSLILAAVILGPASIIFAICMDISFSELIALFDEGLSNLESPDPSMIVGFFGWLGIGLLLLMLGTLAATVAVTGVGCAEMSGQARTWQAALTSAFGMPFVRLIGVYVLLGFGFMILIGVPYGLIIGGIAAESVGLGLFGGFLLFLMIPVVVWISINLAFVVPAVVWEDETITGALQRSWNLVRGHWWRTFGILILLSLIVSFALSIVMTPLYLIVLWDFFRAYFEMLSTLGSGEPDPAFARTLLESFGFGFGVINAISTIAQMIVAPLYTVVMYFDLRARHGEFRQPASPAPQPAG